MRLVYSRRGSDRVRLSVYVLSADIWWISINHFRTFRCFNVMANHNLYCCQIREQSGSDILPSLKLSIPYRSKKVSHGACFSP